MSENHKIYSVASNKIVVSNDDQEIKDEDRTATYPR